MSFINLAVCVYIIRLHNWWPQSVFLLLYYSFFFLTWQLKRLSELLFGSRQLKGRPYQWPLLCSCRLYSRDAVIKFLAAFP